MNSLLKVGDRCLSSSKGGLEGSAVLSALVELGSKICNFMLEVLVFVCEICDLVLQISNAMVGG